MSDPADPSAAGPAGTPGGSPAAGPTAGPAVGPAAGRRGSRGPKKVGAVNLRDVAAHAGVAPATVSRVLGGSQHVNPDTRTRVLAAAAELGYVVNGLARAMTGRGTRSIAFLTSEMAGFTFGATAAGAESVAAANGHLLLLCTTHGIPERERQVIATLCEQRAAAVLLVGSSGTDRAYTERIGGYVRDLAAVGSKLLFCGRPGLPGLPQVRSVDYDHGGGIRSAVSHLAELGHRSVGYVGAPRGGTMADLRLDGYLAGVRENGLEASPRLVAQAQNTIEEGERATPLLLDADRPPTALVCMTDNVAVGAYRAARARGLRIPEDLSIVGFDDVPVVGDLTPGLTTVRPPFRQIGVDAAEIALGLRDGDTDVRLGTSLIVRGSTGRVRD
ncbi:MULTISPECIES: LacI family DNA-binding transcriptional regulator [Streptacidiphilus]|uniref:LacI family DNA-binding transcriptional regulator n=1 Tax=Streptacidiphilus cavernicola TaxID=3342716 RepID=A0ABV6UK58_9ACTN|nr:LacI family DNA-binding transcriptional regulator [Streptacidiphilus jeojiense]